MTFHAASGALLHFRVRFALVLSLPVAPVALQTLLAELSTWGRLPINVIQAPAQTLEAFLALFVSFPVCLLETLLDAEVAELPLDEDAL